MHTKVKNNHIAAMPYLRQILKSRQKNKEARAAFQRELKKTMKQPEGAEGNALKKKVENSPPDDSIGRARIQSIVENRTVIIRKERLNSAPTTTSQSDRTPSPEKTENGLQEQSKTDWETARKQKRKGESKKENPVPTRGKTAPGKATSRKKLPKPKAEAVPISERG